MGNDTQTQLTIRRSILWIIVLVLLVAGGFALSRQKTGEMIKIGVILPLTGSGQDQGEWVKRGLELALEETRAERSGARIELLYEDSKGDPKLAVSAYQKMRLEYTIPAVITWGSGVGLALTPLVNSDKAIQMGVATAVNSYSTPDDFTFRNFPRADDEAVFLSEAVLQKLGVKELAILKINNDYGQSSARAFKDAYTQRGGRVLTEEVFTPNDTDFRTQLTKLKALSPQLVYLAVYPKEGGLVLRQAKEVGLTSRFIASVAILGGREFFDIAGRNAEGLMVVTSAPPFNGQGRSEAVDSFVSAYTKEFGENPGPQQLYTARAYDAFKVLAAAFVQCGDDTICVRDRLFEVKDYEGASGQITFDRNGDSRAEFNIQVVKNGQFVPYEGN